MAAGDGQVVTIGVAREHLRVGNGPSSSEIGDIIAAAEAAIADELGRPLVSIDDDDGGWDDAGSVPPNVVHAVKLAMTVLWDDRTAELPRKAILSLIGRWVVPSFG